MPDATSLPTGSDKTPLAGLSVPHITDEHDSYNAAIAYAKAGLYVFPVNAKTRKPWAEKWQEKSSRDREQIAEWFIGTDYAMAIHVGRSGLVVFDVDKPSVTPDLLAKAIDESTPPYHASRDTGDGRGHYLFALPPGRMVSNSRGLLVDHGSDPADRARSWGEVRGRNGFIIVAPSEHAKAGGHYHWERWGEVPMLPDYLDELLPGAGIEAVDAASDPEVAAFMGRHVLAFTPRKLDAICEAYAKDSAAGSRHEAMVHCVAWAMREAQDGYFPATEARDRLQGLFVASMAGEDRPVLSEYHNAVAWAVGQAAITPSAVTRAAASNPVADPADVAAAKVIDMRTRRTEQRAEAPPELETTSSASSSGGGSTWNEDPEPEPDGAYGGAGADPRAADGAFGEVGEPLRDVRAYFADKDAGIDVKMLAHDVLAIGPLAWGLDNRFWAYRGGVWRSCPEAVIGRCVRLLGPRYRPSHHNAVHHVVRHHGAVPVLNFEPVEDVINFSNGLLDWRTGALRAHDPQVRTTIQLPHEWQPEATCPKFEEFLASILEPETARLMWEIIGYSMLSGNPLQSAVMFVGEGSNGKGTVLRPIGQLLGEDNISSISLDSLNTDKFAPAGLYGKVANIAGDIDATFQESTAAFKMLTGEDKFRGQQKYGQPFDFSSWAVPMFSANKIPGSADTSEGYLRRWVVVPFNTHIEASQRILGLSDQLGAEMPGIAAKGVRALRELMARQAWPERKGAVKAAFEAFAEDIDRVRQWLAEDTEIAELAREPHTVTYRSFVSWASENGTKALSAKEFHNRLASAGHRTVKVRGQRMTCGISVTGHRPSGHDGLTRAQRALGDEVEPEDEDD